MDDFSVSSLHESKNEWCVRLINILTYHIIEGFRSIFNESWKLCKNNNEQEKYLMYYNLNPLNVSFFTSCLIPPTM